MKWKPIDVAIFMPQIFQGDSPHSLNKYCQKLIIDNSKARVHSCLGCSLLSAHMWCYLCSTITDYCRPHTGAHWQDFTGLLSESFKSQATIAQQVSPCAHVYGGSLCTWEQLSTRLPLVRNFSLHSNRTYWRNCLSLSSRSILFDLHSLTLLALSLLISNIPLFFIMRPDISSSFLIYFFHFTLWRRHKQHNRTERRAVEYCTYI